MRHQSPRWASMALLLLPAVGSAQPALSVKAIAAGEEHSLALASDGSVWEWGASLPGHSFGLATLFGDIKGRAAPTQVGGLTDMVAITAGENYSLAVKSDGAVWAWGYNNSGQLGDGTTTNRPAPVQVNGLTGVVAVAAGWGGFQSPHSLAVRYDGTVWAWGTNDSGQLGDGTATGNVAIPGRLTPAQVKGLSGVVAVVAGWSRSVALKGDGTVWTWGWQGVYVAGAHLSVPQLTPVQVDGLERVVAIAARERDNLALRVDGSVWSWLSDQSTPTPIDGLSEVMSIAAGSHGSLAVRRDGSVWAWERNNAPVPVPGLAGAVTVASGGHHNLALTPDGAVWTWGLNNSGQVGDGTMPQRLAPAQVSGVAEVASVSAGLYTSLALKRDGTVWAWGHEESPSLPAPMTGLDGVVAIAAGKRHNLALRDDGTVWAWGGNDLGQVGDGTTTDRSTPVQVSGLAEVSAIAAGGDRSLAVTEDGTVWQWGCNPDAELDNVPFVWRSTAAQVRGLSGIVAVSAGENTFNLALKGDGTVWMWGWLHVWADPNGPPTTLPSPYQVSGLSGVVAIVRPNLALKSDGTLWTVGEVYRWSGPIQMSAVGSIAAIDTGGHDESWISPRHTLELRSDGTVWAWGDNWDGQLGDGTTTYARPAPTQVSGLRGVAAIAAGGTHSLAVKRDGTVWAWGGNYTGQLGDGQSARRAVPRQVVPVGSPDLSISMTHDGNFTIGGRGIYMLTVANTGTTPTAGTVTVIDTLPPALRYLSGIGDGWSCSALEQIVTCTNPGPISSQQSSVITLTVEVESAAWPGVTNLATVSNAADRNSSNNTIGDPAAVSPGRN